MHNREKAVKCLTVIEQILVCRQEICPQEDLQYWIELQEGVADTLALLKEDCHNCKLECLLQKYDELKEKYDALLKEQEAQFVQNIAQQISCKSGLCLNCGKMLNTTCNKKFCGECGQAVKWDV